MSYEISPDEGPVGSSRAASAPAIVRGLPLPAQGLARFDFRFEYELSSDLEVSRRYSFSLATAAHNGDTANYPFDPRDAAPLAFTDVAPEIADKIVACLSPIIPEFEELAARYLGTISRADGLTPGFTLGYVGTIDLRPYYDYSYSGILLFGADGDIDDNDSWKRNYFVNNDGSIHLDNMPHIRAKQSAPWRIALHDLDAYDEVISEFLTRTKAVYEAVRTELRAN